MKAFKFTLLLCAVLLLFATAVMADWDQGDPHKMHFPQEPNPDGWDVCLHDQPIADDFVCSEDGPITDIHFWVSWTEDINDFPNTEFKVEIWDDASGAPNTVQYSWSSLGGTGTFNIRGPYQGVQGWHCPTFNQSIYPDHQAFWQINIEQLPEPFTQVAGTTYWLVIQAVKAQWPPAVGWKTSLPSYTPYPHQSPALWRDASGAWQPVLINGTDVTDMAFVITNDGQQEQIDFGDAPDGAAAPGYPTLFANNGARHTLDGVTFLGAFLDPEPDGQPTAAADGDDLNVLYPGVAFPPGDEDGVVFTTPLVAGQPAIVNVTASTGGILDAWIDFAGDGSWAQASDRITPAGGMPLVAGANPLNFAVPAWATINTTYARFRFSSSGGLSPFGPASNGEVEDYAVTFQPPDDDPNIKYVQWPDLTSTGIDIRVDNGDGVTRHIADDFPCTETGLITDVHFWGSWKGDSKGDIHTLVISFYSDDPVGAGGSNIDNQYSMPDQLLWQRQFSASEFAETPVYNLSPDYEWWWDPYFSVIEPDGDQIVWRYDIDIDPLVAFHQEGTSTNPLVYWLEIQAYVPYQDANEFGWKTSREHWNDDAVWDTGTFPPRVWKELRYPSGHPYNDLPPEQNSVDMAFMITTGNEPCEPDDPELKYIQHPDETSQGTDIRCDRNDGILRTLADDFPCTVTGLITDVHIWGSWKNDEKGELEKIHVSIHDDIPAWQNPDGYSKPGNLLWQRDFVAGEFTETMYKDISPLWESWWDPYSGIFVTQGDQQIWQYDFYIDPCEAFIQQGTPEVPKVYWLDVWVESSTDSEFGWKTSYEHWNDWAVYDVNGLPDWRRLIHPNEERTDMAFAITTGCFPYSDPNYWQWVSVGQPSCWCEPRQCLGDADNGSEGKASTWVLLDDLAVLKASWNKDYPTIAGQTTVVSTGKAVEWICADFDHKPEGKAAVRVGLVDLNILKANWNIPGGPVPNCP